MQQAQEELDRIEESLEAPKPFIFLLIGDFKCFWHMEMAGSKWLPNAV